MNKIKDRNALILTGIVVVALVARFLMLVHIMPQGDLGMSLVGEARNIYDGLGYSMGVWTAGGLKHVHSVYDVPGYALLLAGSWKLLGPAVGTFPIQVLQILIDSFMCVLVYLIGRDLFNRRIGFLAAFLYAIYLPEVYFAAIARRDVWATFCVIGVSWLFLRFKQTRAMVPMVFLGLVIGLGSYFKATLLLLPIALAVTLPCGFWKTIVGTAIAFFVAFVCLLPWGIRNHRIYDRWIFTRCNFYQTIWVGFGEFPNPFGAVNSEEITLRQMRELGFQGTSNSTLDYEDFVQGRVQKALREHPWWYVKTVLRRIPRALIVNRIPWGVLQDDTFTFHRHYEADNQRKNLWDYVRFIASNNPGFLLTKMFDGLLLSLALVGFWLTRIHWKKWVFLATIPAYFVLVHIPLHIEGRYMVPFHWILLLFASVSLLTGFEKLSQRRNRSAIG